MEIAIIILSISLIGVLTILLTTRKKLKVHVEINKKASEQNEQIAKSLFQNTLKNQQIQKEISNNTNTLNTLQKQADDAAKNFLELSMQTAETKFEHSLEKLGEEYEAASKAHEDAYLKALKESALSMSELISTKREELKQVEKELFDIRNTRAALIEAQLREKRISEELDFYCLHLDPIDREDIDTLEKIKNRLNKPRILSMLIWQTFYIKQMNTLIANVLGSEPITGIYKITNIETNECYIGQAVNVGSRFKEHAKCGLGIDTPTGNKLYRAMERYGLTKFSWELLEECDATQLNEKEAYFIDLYKSVDFGYNSVKGVKK